MSTTTPSQRTPDTIPPPQGTMDVATAWLVYAGTEHLMTLPPGGPGGALRGRRVLLRPDRQPSHPACVHPLGPSLPCLVRRPPPGHRARALFGTMAYTGARVGAVTALRLQGPPRPRRLPDLLVPREARPGNARFPSATIWTNGSPPTWRPAASTATRGRPPSFGPWPPC